MNDRLKALYQKAQKRLDLVVTGALILLLIITGYLYLAERNFAAPEPPTPAKKQFTLKLPSERLSERMVEPEEQYVKAVSELREKFNPSQASITEDPKASILIRRNMFDVKSVQEEQEREQEMNRLYNRAEALYNQQKYEEASRLIDDILAQIPTHAEALDLRERLEEARGTQ